MNNFEAAILFNRITSCQRGLLGAPRMKLGGKFSMFDYSVGNARALLSAFLKKLEKYDEETPLKSVDDDSLLAIINMVTDLAVTTRKAYREPEHIMMQAVYKRDMKKYDDALKRCGAVGYSPEGYVRVVVPSLINRRNISFGSSADTFNSLIRPFCQRDEFEGFPPGRYIFVYKRYISKPNSKRCMDNENLDAHNLTNSVCAAFGIGDRALSASFVYSAVKSEYDVDELTVIPYGDMDVVPAILEPKIPRAFTLEGDAIFIQK